MLLIRLIKARYKLFFGLLVALIFIGCNDIYYKIYNKKLASQNIECLNIKSDSLIIENSVKNRDFIKKLYKKECPYLLKISSNYITTCSALRAKAFGSDFDGYVRFEIFKDSELIYRVQKDFKGYYNKEVEDLLINRLKKDLNFRGVHKKQNPLFLFNIKL